MRNKRCPYNKTCNEENAKMDDIWKFDCPKKPFQECLKFEEIELDAISNIGSASNERKE